MYPIILICGKSNVGKDTVSDLITKMVPNSVKLAFADEIKNIIFRAYMGDMERELLWGPSKCRNTKIATTNYISNLGQQIRSFYFYGDPAREFDYHIDDQIHNVLERLPKAVTVRELLITIGTTIGRNLLGKDVWVNHTINKALEQLQSQSYDNPPTNLVVISDGRHRNEILKVKALGGHIIKVIGPADLLDPSSSSTPEAELDSIPNHWFDSILINDKSDGEIALKNAINRAFESVYPNIIQTYPPYPY